jgi:starvation-inducible DNA-binding protein
MGLKSPAKLGSGLRNRLGSDALDGPAGNVQCRRCQISLQEGAHVSKASKSDKVSPDLDTPTDLPQATVEKVSAALNTLLADAFALYLKTKNFHWHVSGRHFRDYHLLLDEQSEAIFATTDQLAERVRKLGGITLRSIGQIAKLQTIQDNNEAFVPPREMLRELMEDNKHMAAAMRKAHKLADDNEDRGTAQLLELFIDETERRTWFLFEASRQEGANAA